MPKEIFGDIDTCVKIWNPLNQTVINTFDSFRLAGDYLGVSHAKVRVNCISRVRVYSPILKMEVAVRTVNASLQQVNIQRVNRPNRTFSGTF